MFSRNAVFRNSSTATKGARSDNDPLNSASANKLESQDSNVREAINRLEPAADDSRPTSRHPVGREYGKHEMLKEIKSTPTSSLSLQSASTSRSLTARPDTADASGTPTSFPSTGFSRMRRVSSKSTTPRKPSVVQQEASGSIVSAANSVSISSSAAPPLLASSSIEHPIYDDSTLSGLLPHDSLGRKLWLQFQAAPDLADLRDMVADSPTGVLVLSQSPYRGTGDPDFGVILNDNVLFTDTPYSMNIEETATDQQTLRKFTTVSGICGTVDRGSVSALGTLPPMEDIMLAISESESPRTTIFDVLDKDMMSSPPLLRLRVVAVCKDCVLPDNRGVQVIVASGFLERSLVVDSAVTTLSARIYDAVDATYGTLLPEAPKSITVNDQIKVDIERIMQYAHSVELQATSSDNRLLKEKSGGKTRKFSWIAGQGGKARPGTQTPATVSPATIPATLNPADIESLATTESTIWQTHMSQLQEDAANYLEQLEKETSMCGDSESRKNICSAIVECVEKLVTEAIYLRIFSPPQWVVDDRAQDEQFASKVAALNMADITLEHLGLSTTPETKNELLRICVETGRLLDRMNSVKSPAEKLKLVVDAHKGVVDRMQKLNEKIHAMEMRRKAEQAENEDNAGDKEESGSIKVSVLAADSILPLLIYSVVKANPSRFVSNLRYIQRYRTRSLLASQFEYCLTNALATASFVDSIDAQKLGLSAELSSSALERAMPPALAALHNLLVNNVVSSVGMDVMQGVADGGKKVAVGVFDATLGRLIDTSSQLIFRGSWKSPTEHELQGVEADAFNGGETFDEKMVDQDNVILGVRDVLNSASDQLSHGIQGHLPRRGSKSVPKINQRFLQVRAEDLTIKEVTQLLASYKEIVNYLCK
ncbi:hypothetical protein GGI25_006238 [Coemansia spiralis]|uniref:VPS9 domain-containing protein n=2 Tax=Coemansia TaxID=4863 RepID=A0A9W8G358_9FUNG|nr:hypothetical protein EDC05_006171 [Coemansia umbellata]KAJ2669181.1 hypothetical protein GGI25_006238 [Coemansia spiralis]